MLAGGLVNVQNRHGQRVVLLPQSRSLAAGCDGLRAGVLQRLLKIVQFDVSVVHLEMALVVVQAAHVDFPVDILDTAGFHGRQHFPGGFQFVGLAFRGCFHACELQGRFLKLGLQNVVGRLVQLRHFGEDERFQHVVHELPAVRRVQTHEHLNFGRLADLGRDLEPDLVRLQDVAIQLVLHVLDRRFAIHGFAVLVNLEDVRLLPTADDVFVFPDLEANFDQHPLVVLVRNDHALFGQLADRNTEKPDMQGFIEHGFPMPVLADHQRRRRAVKLYRRPRVAVAEKVLPSNRFEVNMRHYKAL